MRPHNRVLGGNRVSADNSTTSQTAVGLLDTGVDGPQPVQPLAELGRQTLVRQRHVGEQRVAAARGAIEQIEERGARGLLLKRHVRMPGDGVGVGFQELGAAPVVRAAVDEMNLGEAPGGAGGLVDVVAAEVAAELEGLFDGEVGEVLVAEDCMRI